ncbi:subtilisin-like protein [Punctularia strigosozonata HHB-11173 SS5]|uniref:subtilisin-like protein n=1 Tax=Punctularia strigosozonata (strain HHB-11173) TaxID=741275 RepID=UPI0004416355|nr:subtilisin-like protein [Punctularia strigosozonata HHB-11173 SS5]EIN11974.1 subtilisin-like protein [Punctularia strigosozonata HHB-11173 SS5]
MLAFYELLIIVAVVTSSSASLVFHEGRSSHPSGFVSHGATPDDQTITLRVALASNDIAGLESKMMSMSTPGSHDFRRWLSADEVKSFVAPSDATVAAFNTFAQDNGLETSVISPNGDWVSFTTTVGHANTLFGASFQTFTHGSIAEPLVRTLSVSLPSELVGHVDTIHPTTSFGEPDARLTPMDFVTVEKRAVSASCNSTITPVCLQQLYGIPAIPAAADQRNILLVTGYVQEFAEIADISTFLKQFRPEIDPTTTFNVETVDNGTNPQIPTGTGQEANLDMEYTMGVASGVPVTFLSNGNTDFLTGLADTVAFLVGNLSLPSVMTTSYGANENTVAVSLATKICNGYMALGARGVSVIHASGDGGVRGNHDGLNTTCPSDMFIPVFPASCPFVTAVGATVDIEPERAINFTGGGFSNVFPRPSYQATVVSEFLDTIPSNFTGVFNSSGRAYPDVAAQGWNIQAVGEGEVISSGGTSASAPIFASVIALINDQLLAAGKPVLGFLNPFIYSTASNAFTDITIGKNTGVHCPSTVSAFTATTGWDATSGFGTPVFSKLLAAAMAA